MTIHSFPFICNYLLCKHKPCAFYVWSNAGVLWRHHGQVVQWLRCWLVTREVVSSNLRWSNFFFFFFFFLKKDIFYPLFTFKPLFFFALVYFSFFLSAQFRFFFNYFFFQIDLHVISFSNLYKLNNLLISQLLILSMNYCWRKLSLSIWYIASMSYNQN